MGTCTHTARLGIPEILSKKHEKIYGTLNFGGMTPGPGHQESTTAQLKQGAGSLLLKAYSPALKWGKGDDFGSSIYSVVGVVLETKPVESYPEDIFSWAWKVFSFSNVDYGRTHLLSKVRRVLFTLKLFWFGSMFPNLPPKLIWVRVSQEKFQGMALTYAHLNIWHWHRFPIPPKANK